jgi:hypothetical protein
MGYLSACEAQSSTYSNLFLSSYIGLQIFSMTIFEIFGFNISIGNL